MQISAIICAHNPRADYLRRVLHALRGQTMPKDQWELLLVDNGSNQPLAAEWDLSWHAQARHIREEQLGLANARLCGIGAATGSLIVFVDDDTLLAQDYLAEALQIAKHRLDIGIWGGQVFPQFECEPPAWVHSYLRLLACRTFDVDRWSNIPTENESLPCGAGMCVRSLVAHEHRRRLYGHPLRRKLGRSPNALNSAEDTDLAFTACDLGLGMGQFHALMLHHLIPARRVQVEYLAKLAEGMSYSSLLLRSLRGERVLPKDKLHRYLDYLRLLMLDKRSRAFAFARIRGQKRAFRAIESLASSRERGTTTLVQPCA